MNLIFIPFHDSDDFLRQGIMTREYHILLEILLNIDIEEIYLINKPRTSFEIKVKEWRANSNQHLPLFPNGSKEKLVSQILRRSSLFGGRVYPFSLSQIILRRIWWDKKWKSTIDSLTKNLHSTETIVYSNNPFAISLLTNFKNKGLKIFFDAMDNFAIHPSFNERERQFAYDSYSQICSIADFLSANSIQTCNYFVNNFYYKPELIKNGVCQTPIILDKLDRLKIQSLLDSKTEQVPYKIKAGYVGKLGHRINHNLVLEIAKDNSETLFIYIGPFLSGQGKELEKIFNEQKNIIHFPAIPSAYVDTFLNSCDLLIIPHSVGQYENGGDPLKIYQYMKAKKTIITTPIIGVDELKDFVYIANTSRQWSELINLKRQNSLDDKISKLPESIVWGTRLEKMLLHMKLISQRG